MSQKREPIVYIISAPSGSGKSTLVNELLRLTSDLDFSISYTTREPRGAEKNGKQYFFVSREQFEQMIRADEFIEHADVFGNYYGTARRFLKEAESKGHDLLLDIDVQGAALIKPKLVRGVSIFVLPPDRQTLEKRLIKRGEDDPRVIRRRLDGAGREIENYSKYDYILINDDLAESIKNLQAIVRSERLRASGESLSDTERDAVARADRCRLANVKDRVQRILESFKNPPASASS
jgi:guanylate kinase